MPINGVKVDNDAARRAVFVGLPKRITVLSIGELGYCILGRGGAVGAGRKLPACERPLAGSPAFVATWRAASQC